MYVMFRGKGGGGGGGGLNPSAKTINSGQPAWSAQADLCRNFLLSVNSLDLKGPMFLTIESFDLQNGFDGSVYL